MEIKDISLRDYLNLPDEERKLYDFYMKFSLTMNRPIDNYNIGDITKQPFGIVKDIQYDMLNEGLMWYNYIDYLNKMTNRKTYYLSESIISLCQQKKYIINEIERLTEIENQLLQYTPTDAEIRAGIEKFNPFGVYLQMRSIAIKLNMKISEVREMKYEDALVELTLQKTIIDFEEAYNKIINDEIRNKK